MAIAFKVKVKVNLFKRYYWCFIQIPVSNQSKSVRILKANFYGYTKMLLVLNILMNICWINWWNLIGRRRLHSILYCETKFYVMEPVLIWALMMTTNWIKLRDQMKGEIWTLTITDHSWDSLYISIIWNNALHLNGIIYHLQDHSYSSTDPEATCLEYISSLSPCIDV